MYYEILFPDQLTLVVKTGESYKVLVQDLSTAIGLKSASGAIYNPKQYVRIRHIEEPGTWHKHVARPLRDILMA